MTWQQDAQRLAVCSWDLSWLLRRGKHRGEYAALERVLDETQRRGFNALRVDPCPHLLAEPEDAVHVDRCELLPNGHPPVEVRIRHSVRQLLQSARERGLKLWLSSRFINDSRARRSFVRRPSDFVSVWSQTLDLIDQWGYLDVIAGLDFCYQFPALPQAHGACRRIFKRSPERPLPARWPSGAEEQVEQYLLEIPRTLRALFPEIPIGLSTTATLSEHLRQLDTSELDFLDFNLWLDDDPRYQLAMGNRFPVPGPLSRLAAPMKHLILEAGGLHWQRRLESQLQRRLSFSRVRRLAPVIGGGFVRLPDGYSKMPLGWSEFTEVMVSRAIEEGVTVINPSSAATPEHPWLWKEQDYLAHLNHLIVRG